MLTITSKGMSFTALGSGGEYKHLLTESEMPRHVHGQNVTAGNNGGSLRIDYNDDKKGVAYPQGVNTNHAGGSQSHNIIQPWIGVYFWRRTA